VKAGDMVAALAFSLLTYGIEGARQESVACSNKQILIYHVLWAGKATKSRTWKAGRIKNNRKIEYA
jgi:hypothetical protein